MTYFYFYLIEISILFLLNRALNINLLRFLHSRVKNKKLILYLYYIIYLPSILFHELAHFLAAKLMFLPVNSIRLFPKLEDNKFRMGSVKFGSGGVLRNFVASSAPFWLGNITLYLLIGRMLAGFSGAIAYALSVFIVFQLANALVLSWEDIKSALTIYILVAILIVVISAGLITINFESKALVNYFITMDKYLLVPMTINAIFVIMINIP